MIYRRFGFMRTRVLLQKQDELVELEKLLDQLDMQDKYGDSKALQNRLYDEGRGVGSGSRRALLDKIEGLLTSYDQLLLASHQLLAANRPTKREHNCVVHFLADKGTMAEGEDHFVRHKEDLVTLRPGRETAWLDRFFMKIISGLHRNSMKKIFYQKVRLKTSPNLS